MDMTVGVLQPKAPNPLLPIKLQQTILANTHPRTGENCCLRTHHCANPIADPPIAPSIALTSGISPTSTQYKLTTKPTSVTTTHWSQNQNPIFSSQNQSPIFIRFLVLLKLLCVNAPCSRET